MSIFTNRLRRFCQWLPLAVKSEGVISYLNVEEVLHRFLDFLHPGVAKFKDLSIFDRNKMIMLFELERPFKLGTIIPELMFGHQVAIKQQFYGIVKGSPAYTILVVLHPDVEGFNIEMPVGCIDLP